MRVALFIPCYVDQIRPEVGLATLRLLEHLGFEVVYPADQTCCGQPFLTAGKTAAAADLSQRHARLFRDFDAIVTPSGSCAAALRGPLRGQPDSLEAGVADRTRELCEFLVEQDVWPERTGDFPHRVGVHASCHALRELRLGTPSETREPKRSDPAQQLLGRLGGIELIDLVRRDECCGFGGLFSVREEAVSCRMGLDRLADHQRGGAQIMTSTDVSCLLHLGGLAKQRKLPIRTLHVAEILAEALIPETAHGTC